MRVLTAYMDCLFLLHFLCSSQYSHDFQANPSMSARLRSCTNGIHKILTLQPQRLNPINMRNGDRAIAIRNDGVGINVCPFVINLDHFSRIGIVIDRHSRVAYHSHAANFTRMEPADMNMSAHPICKFKIEMSNIIDVWEEMRVCLHADLLRCFAEDIHEYRDIMGSKIPNHICVSTKHILCPRGRLYRLQTLSGCFQTIGIFVCDDGDHRTAHSIQISRNLRTPVAPADNAKTELIHSYHVLLKTGSV